MGGPDVLQAGQLPGMGCPTLGGERVTHCGEIGRRTISMCSLQLAAKVVESAGVEHVPSWHVVAMDGCTLLGIEKPRT